MLDSTHFINVAEKGNQNILMQGKSRSWSFLDMFIIPHVRLVQSISKLNYLQLTA